MPGERMHADELDVDEALVRRLLAGRFPGWAGLRLARVESAGTDHAIYRLGDRLSVRLPRIAWAAPQADTEHAWLPRLAPHVPLALPEPLGRGEPADGYPWPWSVQTWLPGANAGGKRLRDPSEAATALARFVLALQRVGTTGAPRSPRGGPLTSRDAETRRAIAEARDLVDSRAAVAAWEEALRAPPYAGAPVWSHGDLLEGNLLQVDGRLSGVIDFGCLGAGDPMCDLLPAWALFTGEAREVYRAELAVDDATWARGRGLALSVGLLILPYYRDTNAGLYAVGKRMVDAVLADRDGTSRPA